VARSSPSTGANAASGLQDASRESRIGDDYALPLRWSWIFFASVTLPLALLFVYPVAPQNGVYWDLAMVVGSLAAGLMIAVPIVSPRVWLHYGGNARALRALLYLHHDVSYAIVILLLLHVLGLVYLDPTVIEYLKLSAPWSMLAGLIAALLVLVLVISSRYRISLNLRYAKWRTLHVGMSVVAMVLMTFHIIDAGFFVNSPLKKIIFLLLAAGPSLVAFGLGRWRGSDRLGASKAMDFSAESLLRMPRARAYSLRIVFLLVLLCLVSMVNFALPTAGSRAEQQAQLCTGTTCE
jgi:hypothetical protein